MTQPSLILEAQFMDREKELSSLKTLLEQTLAGKGCTVFVSGEGGVGKTRLVKEFGQYADRKGAVFLEGSSYEQEGAIPYSPWIDVIRSFLSRFPSERLRNLPGWVVAEIGRLVPAILAEAEGLGLKAWLAGPRSSLAVGPPVADQDRIRLFQAITDFLVSSSKERPVVVFLDDISWADHASLQLFHYVARRAPERKLMLIGAYRDVELPDDHPLAKIRLDLNRQRIVHPIPVTRFTQGLVTQLLASHLRGPVSENLAQLIYSRTGGNAYFAEELVRSLMDEDLLQESEDGWTIKDVQHVEMPSSIRSVIKQRTSRLGEDCIQLLSIAALMGMEFDLEILRRVASVSDEDLTELLHAALEAHLIREKREGKKSNYVFADGQIQEFLAEQVGVLRKRKYHVAIGLAVEEVYGDNIDEHLGELAYHFVEGGEIAKAKKYSILAGDKSARLFAHDEAVRHFTNALELLGQDEIETRLDLLTKLGQTAYVRGNHKEVERFCGQAIEIAVKLGLKTTQADLYALLGISHFILDNSKEKAIESFQRGLKVLEGSRDTLQEAVLLQHLGRVYALTGQLDMGRTWADRAITIASKLGAYDVLAHSYLTMALTMSLQDKESQFSYMEKALDLAIKHNIVDPALRAYNNLATSYANLKCDYVRAKELLLKGIAHARKLGYLDFENFMQASLAADVYLPMGEWEECQRLVSQTIGTRRELGGKVMAPLFYAQASIALAREDLARAREHVNNALQASGEWIEPTLHSLLIVADLSLAENQLDDAEKTLLKANEYSNKMQGGDILLLLIPFRLVVLNLRKERLDQALLYCRELHEVASKLDENWGYGFEHWAKGLISEAQNYYSEGVRLLKDSVEGLKMANRPYDLAQALLDLARLEERAGLNKEAKQSVEEATNIFGRLGIAKKPRS